MRKFLLFKYVIFVLILVCCFKKGYTQEPQMVNLDTYERFWLQYSNDGRMLFRFISTDTNSLCPTLQIDDENFETSLRIFEDKEKVFPIKVCQKSFDPKSNHSVFFRGSEIKLVHSDPSKALVIAALGDTGCLIFENKKSQNCNDSDSYPFAKIAQAVARENPDLILHVGDYWYSEYACIDKEKCSNKFKGDNWWAWRADFLDSAEPIFKKAPIIFTRGNHEACDMGGVGWSILLDPGESFQHCQKIEKAYNVPVNNINFLVLDSSSASDAKLRRKSENEKEFLKAWSKQIDNYKIQFDLLESKIDAKSLNILVTHRPLYSFDHRSWIKKSNHPMPLNKTLQQAIALSKLAKSFNLMPLIFSGHTHALSSLHWKDKKNTQLTQVVTGGGGALLNESVLLDNTTNKIDNFTLENKFLKQKFGYSMLKVESGKFINDLPNKAELKFCDPDGVEYFKEIVY